SVPTSSIVLSPGYINVARSVKVRCESTEDPIGKPSVDVEQRGNYLNLRCEAKHGTSSYFYLNNGDLHFKKQPYKDNVCVGRVAQGELLTMRKRSSPGEIFITCLRCESPEGTECHFYRDHDPNPIRTVDYKQGACQFKLLWNEFKKWNKTEIDLSCIILQSREGKTNKTSNPSIVRRLHVSDPIGKPSVHVKKIGNYLNLRCEAKAGTSCYFYQNNGDLHFKKLPYKDKVCVGRVAEEELQRKRSSAGEIFITCAVELVVEDEDTVTSQRSEPLGITIDGATSSPSAFSLIIPGKEKASSNVTAQGKGLVPTPTIVLFPGNINVATPATLRCESPEGTECHFYRDHDPNPIRKLDYKKGACQFKLLWNEFKKWNKTEIDLSCIILQNREGKMIKTSKPSVVRRLHVSDPIGKPSVHVEKIGNYLNLRCEAKAGTSCYFYQNNGDLHFKKLPYKDYVCVGRVAEEELQRKRSSAGEIFITCAVELVVEGEDTVTSQRSEPLGITINGLVPTPTIVLFPGYINVATPATLRCESPEGTECHFYRDHDPNPIRKLDYKQGACQFKLLWNEFKKWNKTEVDLSCIILQNREGKMINTSKPSIVRRLHVSDPIGKPSVHVEKIGNYLNLRCEDKAGTSCYFYQNNGDLHFKKLPYKDNVCVGRVAEEELQRKRSSAGEIFITCAVELVVEGEDTVTSQRSEPLGITIDGATSSPSAFSLIIPGQVNVSSNVTTQGPVLINISLGAGSLFMVLLAGSVLCVLQHKCEAHLSSKTKPHLVSEEDTSLQYATVTSTSDRASLQYATVTSTGDKENQTNTWITKEKKHQISVSLKFVTLTEVVELSCESSALVEGQQCLFHVDSEFKELGRSNASHNHCSLPVRGSELLGWKHRGLWSKVTVHCHYEEEEGIHSPPSKNVTVVVWNTKMLTKYIIGCMALIGFIILLAVFIFCITCLLSLKAKSM
ncbi:unnamed protein product, partial [Coregonus sp. 'balchen']